MTTISKLPNNLLNSQEAIVYNASSCPKLSDLPNDESLVVVITMWRNYLGVKEAMTIDEISMNIGHIKNNYPDFTLEMINLAIKLSLTGVLSVDTKPYGTFSPLYISSILNEYKKHSTAIRIKVAEKIKREKEYEFINPVYTEQQKKENRLSYLEFYRDNVAKDVLRDFKGIMWDFVTKYNLVENIEADKELVRKETIKKQNQFIDMSIKDITELEQYSIMKKFYQVNPKFDFNNYELLWTKNKK